MPSEAGCAACSGPGIARRLVLAWIYIARGLAIVALVFLPKTEFVALAFAGTLGLLGLGTVPLTSGLIARIFGTGNLGMLFGLCFLNHQIGAVPGGMERWMAVRADRFVRSDLARHRCSGRHRRPAALPHSRRAGRPARLGVTDAADCRATR